jgi:hypothetical protein
LRSAESGEDSTDRKERDGGCGGLHRHTGAEDEQVGSDTESATEPGADVATRDRTAEAVAIDSLVSTRAKIPDRHERLGDSRARREDRGDERVGRRRERVLALRVEFSKVAFDWWKTKKKPRISRRHRRYGSRTRKRDSQ